MPPSSSRSAWGIGPARPYHGWADTGTGSDLADPFAVNPIRRSFGLVAASCLIVFGAPLFGEPVTTVTMLTVGWLAMTGIVMGTPILLWSLVEEGWRRAQRRLDPPVEELDLAPRLRHVLVRHGYASIAQVERAPDAALLVLSNMDTRGLRDVRRAVSLWRYRRWQERGFPDRGMPL